MRESIDKKRISDIKGLKCPVCKSYLDKIPKLGKLEFCPFCWAQLVRI